MQIERTLRDPGGTKVPMGGVVYHFRPVEPDGPHLAEVENIDHQRVFLSIPEGYRIHGETPEPGQEPADDAPTDADDETQTPADPQAPADPAAPADDLEAMDDETLRAVFKDALGRAAPPKSKPETMIAQIRAARAPQE